VSSAGPVDAKTATAAGRERRLRRARRVLYAYGRRIAQGDIDALEDIAQLSAEIDTAMSQAVAGLGARGYSWAEIGAGLGITRQAAQQRWGHPA